MTLPLTTIAGGSLVLTHPQLATHDRLKPRPDIMAMEMKETPDFYIALAETPGVPKDNIRLSLENGILSISAEIPKLAKKDPDERILFSERPTGRLSGQITIPKQVDMENIKAQYDHGLLKVLLPKLQSRGEGAHYIHIN